MKVYSVNTPFENNYLIKTFERMVEYIKQYVASQKNAYDFEIEEIEESHHVFHSVTKTKAVNADKIKTLLEINNEFYVQFSSDDMNGNFICVYTIEVHE